MLYLTASIFFLLSLVTYCITKSIFHPGFIVSAIWGLLIFLYGYLDHPFWHLSDRFFYAINLWVIPFCIITLIIGQYKKKKSVNTNINKHIDINQTYPSGNVRQYNILMPYVFIVSIMSIIIFLLYSRGNMVNLRNLLLASSFPPYLKAVFYLSTFFTSFLCFGLLNYKYVNKRHLVFLAIIIFIISIFKSNKTSFLALFVSISYILYYNKKLKLSSILLSVICLVLLLVIVSSNRGDWDFKSDGGIANYIYIYLFSPLTAFDCLLNNEVNLGTPATGEGFFIFFYNILNIFGAGIKFSVLGTWINVPLPTNVYTAMRCYYLEGGFYGIAFASIINGLIWGILYNLQHRRKTIFVVFYATMIPTLFFQSFGDYFFYSFSMTLQYLLFAIILTKGIKTKRIRLRLVSNYKRIINSV